MSAALRELSVTKMHGAHNDFIVVDERTPQLTDYPALARRLCERAGEIGADGMLVLSAPPAGTESVATMQIFNADGSEAEMCGNGIRCVAKYLAERGAADSFTIATLSGPIAVDIVAHAPEFVARADVGVPDLPSGGASETIEAAGETWTYRSVSLGNPHIVIVVDDVAAIDVERIGAMLATHERFPGGTNVHFAQSIDRQELMVRHYERGVGITQACGTGAVACAVAAIVAGTADSPVGVRVPGGRLTVNWTRGGSATLAGPAETVFERTIEL
jgi:diaminopimelate epimerase